MLIDWFTTCAQLLNFLILVWLMKRFLYRPVLAAIAARDAQVAAQLDDAAARQKAAQQQSADYQKRTADFERDSATLMREAVARAQSEQQRLSTLGRQVDEAARTAQQKALAEAQQRLGKALTLQVRDEVFALARHALAELADMRLEEAMVRRFARRVAQLDPSERAQLAAVLAAAPQAAGPQVAALQTAAPQTPAPQTPAPQTVAPQTPVQQTAAPQTTAPDVAASVGADTQAALLRTAMPLDDALQLQVTEALRTLGLAPASLRFEVAPQLVCGIEFSIGGWKLAWTIDDYLRSLQERTDNLLKTANVPAGATAP